MPDLTFVKENLDDREIDYVVTQLHSILFEDGSIRPVHAVQYYTEQGDDVLSVVVGDTTKMVSFQGFLLLGNQRLEDAGVLVP